MFFSIEIEIPGNILLKFTDYLLPYNHTETLCFKLGAVNIITKTSKYYHKLRANLANTGLSVSSFEAWHIFMTFKGCILDSIKRTANYLVFNSTKPLR